MVGKKAIVVLGGVAIALAAVFAWRWWSTDGLLAVGVAAILAGIAGIGWLIAQSERRLRQLTTKRTPIDLEAPLAPLAQEVSRVGENLTTLADQVDEVRRSLVTPADHAEQFLVALNSRFSRLELTNQRLSDELNAVIESWAAAAKPKNDQTFRQLEALLSLYRETDGRAGFPRTRSWVASPDLLLYLYHLVRQLEPDLVIECGSGLSTVIMGYALRDNRKGQLVALEHLEPYLEQTERWISQHEIQDHSGVVLAPLENVILAGEEWTWYSTSSLPAGNIDLLFVDGPPAATGNQARYPALPMLRERMSRPSVIVLDDVKREEELQLANRWLRENPSLEMELLDHEKGSARFTLT